MQLPLLSEVRLQRAPRFSAFRSVSLLFVGLLLPLLSQAQSTISGASNVKGSVGCPLTYQIIASGNVTGYSCSTLPAGLTLNANTGVILGVPTAAASLDVVVRAFTAGGNGEAALHFDIAPTIPGSAQITSGTDLRATAAAPFSYQIVATNFATLYSCSPVPAGLSFNATTGVLSGTPNSNSSGIVHLTLTASNPMGSSTTTATLRLNGPGVPTITSIGDDTGIAGDRITSDLTLTLTGKADANAKVTIFENNSAIGTVTADASGNWTFTRADSGYPSARLQFTATATDALGNASEHSAVSDILLTSPLQVNNLVANVDVGAAVRIDVPIIGAQGQLDVDVTGLPFGLSFNPNDRSITGSVGAAGTFTINVAATAQTAASGTITLNVNATTPNIGIAAPSGLTVTGNAATQVTLTWNDNANNETGGVLERSLDGVNFSAVLNLDANATTGTDNTVSALTTYYYRVKARNASGQSEASNTVTVTTPSLSPTGNPVITTQPVSIAASLGARVNLTAGASGSTNATFQWLRNGAMVAGATNGTLTLDAMAPGNAGIYAALVTEGGTTATAPAIVGLSFTGKLAGLAREVGADIRHPNGNIYDQILLEGDAAGITADAGQVVRLSFCDLNGDIVQVEFSGAGTLAIGMDNAATAQVAANYNQPGVLYVRGHATIVVSGANETTNLSIFTVGRLTAIDQSLFKAEVAYDGVADLAAVAILSANGRFGGLRAANANFFATTGVTGVLAPGVSFVGPCYVGDISANADARAVLQLGSCADVRVAGGDMAQANGRAVAVSGVTRLQFVAGTDSHGKAISAKANLAQFDENGTNVTAKIVVNPGP